MISYQTPNAVLGTDQAATSARSLRALDPTWILGAEVRPQHDLGTALAVTPDAGGRRRRIDGTLVSMKINKFESQPIPGSIPWGSSV